MKEKKGHSREVTTEEQRPLEVICLEEALKPLGLGGERTDEDLQSAAKLLVDEMEKRIKERRNTVQENLDWEDIIRRSMVPINGPPGDGRCDCCGKHISEVTPFDDPFYFDGPISKYLHKNFRDFDGCVSPSWECSDCLHLGIDDYYKSRNQGC
jgi:hypothetical protein